MRHEGTNHLWSDLATKDKHVTSSDLQHLVHRPSRPELRRFGLKGGQAAPKLLMRQVDFSGKARHGAWQLGFHGKCLSKISETLTATARAGIKFLAFSFRIWLLLFSVQTGLLEKIFIEVLPDLGSPWTGNSG